MYNMFEAQVYNIMYKGITSGVVNCLFLLAVRSRQQLNKNI